MSNNKKKLLVFLALFLIVLLSLAIGFLGYKSKQPTTAISTNYKGYDILIAKLNTAADTNQAIAQEPNFQRVIRTIKIVEDPKASKKDVLKSLKYSLGYSIELYQDLHDHKAYHLQLDINDFIVANFPEEKNNGFKPFCFDPECASPMDPAIKNVISEIQNSQVPDYQKQNDIDNLTNFSYLTNDNSGIKVRDFLLAAKIIESNPEYIKLGINEKLYNEIIDYLKNTYPKDFKTNFISPTPTNE